MMSESSCVSWSCYGRPAQQMWTLYCCPAVSSSTFLLFFSRLISAVAEWMSTILYTWCDLSADSECRSKMRCTWLAGNTGLKNDAKNRHLGTIAQLCQAESSQLRHASTVGKKLAKQQYLLHMSPQYGELRGPLAAEIVSFVWGTPANFNGFRFLAVLLNGTRAVGTSQILRS